MEDCEGFKLKLEKCKSKHGNRNERCSVWELKEKRCLSFRHCTPQAEAYYGTLDGPKALCASFEEAFCFGNPRIMGVDSAKEKKANVKTFESHQKAKSKVMNNRQRFRDCQALSQRLTRCLRQNS